MRLTLNWHSIVCIDRMMMARVLFSYVALLSRQFSGHSAEFISLLYSIFNSIQSCESVFGKSHCTIKQSIATSANSQEDYQKKNRRWIKFTGTFTIDSRLAFCLRRISSISKYKNTIEQVPNERNWRKRAYENNWKFWNLFSIWNVIARTQRTRVCLCIKSFFNKRSSSTSCYFSLHLINFNGCFYWRHDFQSKCMEINGDDSTGRQSVSNR